MPRAPIYTTRSEADDTHGSADHPGRKPIPPWHYKAAAAIWAFIYALVGAVLMYILLKSGVL